MRERVIADVMSFVHGSTDDVRVLKSAITPKEERCLDIGSGKTAQNLARVLWVRAVVEGERNGSIRRWPVDEEDSPRQYTSEPSTDGLT
jgi:hypothetical protein